MSIKSDHWIRRMAEQQGMIEPFEPGQVRHQDEQRIISYGTSSYGRKTSTKKTLSMSFPMSASFRRIALPWRAPLSISASRAAL